MSKSDERARSATAEIEVRAEGRELDVCDSASNAETYRLSRADDACDDGTT